MSTSHSRLTPHRAAIDFTPLEGLTVLGEPLAVLVSGLLRLQVDQRHDGTAELTARWTTEEAESLERAMERVERPVPGDARTPDQRNADRFVLVAEQVMETALAVAETSTP